MKIQSKNIDSNQKYSYEYLVEDILHVCDINYKISQFILLIRSFNIYIKHCIKETLATAIRCLKPLPFHPFLENLVSFFKDLASSFKDLASSFKDLASSFRNLVSKAVPLASRIEFLASSFKDLASKAIPLTSKIEFLVSYLANLVSYFKDLASKAMPLTSFFAKMTSLNATTKYKDAFVMLL
ncbi:MAG: hypothetical protein WCL51_06050 [Bacteroidota bacterium]